MNGLQFLMVAILVIVIAVLLVYFISSGDIDDTSGALYFLGGLFTVMNVVQQYVVT
jgi:hypothetical protein